MKTFLSTSTRRGAMRALLVAPLLAATQACTDLTEVPKDALTPDNAFRTPAEILAGNASVYAGLRGTMWAYYNLSEISTDEMIVPTRGQDWFDNGRWLEIHRQTWGPNSGSALDDMNGMWNDLFRGVARANLMIEVVTQNDPNSKQALAELRTLRAWYYYMLMDMFGRVPLVTDTKLEARPNATRAEIFSFVESELLAVRADLPLRVPAAEYGRLTRGAANAILASLYLNARVFSGTPTASGITLGAAKWTEAIAAADAVINSGVYTLNANFRQNFTPDNENSPENIFVVVHSPVSGLGMSIPMRTLHYNQLNPSPWNGFAALAETYNAFNPADARRGIFLVGPQVSFNTGEPVNDRQGNRLNFTVNIANADAAAENEGARYNKFVPLPGAVDGDSHPNDYPFFRLAEMYLIKAEALNELGQTGAAITEINRVRARAFGGATNALAGNLSQDQVREAILNERLFEFAGEGKRRQDLIRFGRYTAPKRFAPNARSGFRVLMPIPETQLQANPRLTQNPGY